MKKIYFIFSLFFIPFILSACLMANLLGVYKKIFKIPNKKIRVVFGSSPILNIKYWSQSLCNAGFLSETFVFNYFDSISERKDWDNVLRFKYLFLPYHLRPFLAFILSLFKYDIFILSYRGYFLQNTIFRFLQADLLRLANKKIVIIPYGSDAYVYRNIRSSSWTHALMISYPDASKKQMIIAREVDYWNRNADAVIPGMMGFDGIARWDVFSPSSLVLDLDDWKATSKIFFSDGFNEKIVIAHSPNHRGCKGTEYLIHAIERLQSEGFLIELLLLEKIQNSKVKQILCERADILVEQLIFTGHGLSGLEGMASGIPTISNLEDETYTLPMRRWSFLNECPLVSATPEDITDVLRELITNPSLRIDLGRAGREYVEKYHGLDSAQYLFENVFDYIYGKKDSIINLYHPILGEYPNRSPKVKHPLVNNRIVDYQS